MRSGREAPNALADEHETDVSMKVRSDSVKSCVHSRQQTAPKVLTCVVRKL